MSKKRDNRLPRQSVIKAWRPDEMRKTFHILALLFLMTNATQVWAYSGSVVAPSGQQIYYSTIYSSGNIEITIVSPNTSYSNPWGGYSKPTGDLVIPDSVTHNGIKRPVISINIRAFYGCGGLTSVTIPNSVTTIDNYAFSDCSGLTSVTIPNSVTCIGHDAFSGCSGLTSVTIPNSVTSISNYAFYECSGLTSATIPNSVTSIGNFAFAGCGLTSVTIPNSVTTIGNYSFAGCGLTSVTIPNAVTYIGNSAFAGFFLTSVEFNADSCTYMGGWDIYGNIEPVFSGSSLVTLTIGNNVKVIPGYAFYGCSDLTSVTIPNSVTSIGNDAFSGCSGLTSVTIPNSVTSIGNDAFSGCSGLTSVTIPNSVTSIGNRVFYGCTGLTSVTIPNSITIIASSAFEGCTGLTSVTIPNSITIIASSAFKGCTGLTSVAILNSVTSIGNDAFSGCSGLTSVTIPNSVTSIGSGAFSGCSGLTSMTIPDSVTSIGDSAFTGCVGMTSMKFLGQMPPQLGTDVFVGIQTDIPVYIPCGRLAYYVAQMPQFSNFVEQQVGFSAISDNDSMGSVQILTEPSCSNPNAVLYAVPADGYRFGHWSTGSTDNPYTLTVTNDTTIIAYFVANGGTEGIDEVGEDDIRISVFNGSISVEGVEQKDIHVYDITGRITDNRALLSGVYIVKIGQLPARKVVVIK